MHYTMQYDDEESDGMNPPQRKRPRLNSSLGGQEEANSTSMSSRPANGNLSQIPSPLLNTSQEQLNVGTAARDVIDRARYLNIDSLAVAANNDAMLGGLADYRLSSNFDRRLHYSGLTAPDNTFAGLSSHLSPQIPPGLLGNSLLDQHRLAILGRLSSLQSGAGSSPLEIAAMRALPADGVFPDYTNLPARSTLNNLGILPSSRLFNLPTAAASNAAALRQLIGAGGFPSTTAVPSTGIASIPTRSSETGRGGEMSHPLLNHHGNSIPSLRGAEDPAPWIRRHFPHDQTTHQTNSAPLPEASLSSSTSSSTRGSSRRFVPGNKGASTASLRTTPEQNETIQPYYEREIVPLATDEDQNWLSEFLCFVRLELIEVFRANHDDVKARNSSKKVCLGQVGIRCRFCAHLPLGARASRSSSYPSSVSRIYQSLTMMIRDHLTNCKYMPKQTQKRFLDLKSKTSQGATDSKQYWVHSAHQLGLMDSDNGISIGDGKNVATESPASAPAAHPRSDDSRAAGRECLRQPGMNNNEIASSAPVSLVTSEEISTVSSFIYTVMSHAQLIHMEESERIGNRKGFPVGLPGIGCLHCCQSNRKGNSRLFTSRRRRLGSKINDLYEHLRRCTVCPPGVKEQLIALKAEEVLRDDRSLGEKAFYDRIWARMGHNTGDAFKKTNSDRRESDSTS